MAYIPLRNIGAGGLVPDQNPYDVELTQFPSGNNVSFQNGIIGKTLGHTDVGITIPNSDAPVTVAGFFNTGANNIFIGSRTKIYRYNGSAITDVTRTSSGYSNTTMWQVEQIGSGIIFNNSADKPQYISSTILSSNGEFIDLANWPATLTTTSLKPYKSFLILAGYSEGGSLYNTRVRWSDEFDPSSVPSSYDVTSTTNLAGFNELGGENGNLVDQLTLGNTQIIYAERGVYAMDFIGAPLVFSFRELFSDDGIISRGACASWEGKHLVVGNGDIYVHDGSSKTSIANLKVRNEFYNALIDTESVFCESLPSRSEIWIFYSVFGAVKDGTDNKYSPNKCLIYNWENNAFTFRDVPNLRSATHADVMAQGGTLGTWSASNLGNYNNTTNWWANSSFGSEAEENAFFGVDHVNKKLFKLNDSRGFNGGAIDCFLEASKIDLDAVLGTANNNIKQIVGIMPQIKGEGSLTIKIGASNAPQDGVSFQQTKTFNITSDHKIDVRTSGRYLALRFESNESTNFWNLSGLDIDVKEVAGR